jgi:hypothetical protein
MPNPDDPSDFSSWIAAPAAPQEAQRPSASREYPGTGAPLPVTSARALSHLSAPLPRQSAPASDFAPPAVPGVSKLQGGYEWHSEGEPPAKQVFRKMGPDRGWDR